MRLTFKFVLQACVQCAAFCSALPLSAQSIRYETKLDDANIHPKLVANFQYGHLEINTSNLAGSSANMGVWGYYELDRDKLQIDYNLQKAWWLFGAMVNWDNPRSIKSPGNHEANVGVNYFFKTQSVRRENIKKGMYINTSQGRTGSVTFKTSRYMKFVLAANVKRLWGYRAGLYFKNDLYRYQSFNKAYVNQYNAGVYIGLQTTNIRNLAIDVANNGIKTHAFGQTFFVDAMLLPINPYVSVDSRYTTEQVKAAVTEKPLPFGFRAGYRYFQTAPQSVTNKKYGLGVSGEIGYRPYHGIYVSGGIAVAINRK